MSPKVILRFSIMLLLLPFIAGGVIGRPVTEVFAPGIGADKVLGFPVKSVTDAGTADVLLVHSSYLLSAARAILQGKTGAPVFEMSCPPCISFRHSFVPVPFTDGHRILSHIPHVFPSSLITVFV